MPMIDDFLRSMHLRKGSDLHVIAGDPPRMRVNGDLITLENQPLDPEELRVELSALMSPQSLEQFNAHDAADFAHFIPDVARFRVNVFRHLNGIGAVFRGIPSKALTLEELNMPESVHELGRSNRGLILV
ncbi:MAG: type IV pili twitching motility protein PilT, partial [Gammaproteobacteria bacterium]|nr:type IV pili twitching motility protein PilT [Gammaproteobacteria bacterium]